MLVSMSYSVLFWKDLRRDAEINLPPDASPIGAVRPCQILLECYSEALMFLFKCVTQRADKFDCIQGSNALLSQEVLVLVKNKIVHYNV